jgi:hypothetical protein
MRSVVVGRRNWTRQVQDMLEESMKLSEKESSDNIIYYIVMEKYNGVGRHDLLLA